jgi:hypothetical protein
MKLSCLCVGQRSLFYSTTYSRCLYSAHTEVDCRLLCLVISANCVATTYMDMVNEWYMYDMIIITYVGSY